MDHQSKFKPTIFFEVEDILPRNSIPINDSFTFSIKYFKKTLTELFPIQNILSFQLEDISKSALFSVKISKGPMTIFKGDFEISKLVFLNKEISENKSIGLTPYEANKKLISSIKGISSLKVIFKIRITYTEKEKTLLLKKLSAGGNINSSKNNYKSENDINLGIIDNNPNVKVNKFSSTKKFNSKGLNFRNAEDISVPRDSLIDTDHLKFMTHQEKNYETSEIENELKEGDVEQKENKEHAITSIEREKFALLMSDLTNAIANFENLPCTKFSTSIGEKFFKLHHKYFSIFEEYSLKYHRLRKYMNKYNERYRLYNKMNFKLKNSLKFHEEKLNFQMNISNYERMSNINQNTVMIKQLKFFESLFENITGKSNANNISMNTSKEYNKDTKETKDREITNINKSKQITNSEKVIDKEKADEDNNSIISAQISQTISSDWKLLKSVLENLNKNPEMLSKIPEHKFCVLKSKALKYGIKLEVPAEWYLDKIEEVPEQSMLTSEKDEFSQIKGFE